MVTRRETGRRAAPITESGEETDVATLLRNILGKLSEIHRAMIAPPRGIPEPGHPPVHVVRVRVSTPGQARQGPDMPVPPGQKTAVRVRLHPTAAPTGYVAFSRTTIADTVSRLELSEGLSVQVDIANWNVLWFDSNTADTDFEIVVEMYRVGDQM